MAILSIPRYNTTGHLDAGYKSFPRVLDFVIDLSDDVTMGTATDSINIAMLPEGTIVVAASIQQLTVGSGSGTLAVQTGATAVSSTLLATAAVGTVAATLPAAIASIVPAGGAILNLQGAVAARTTGKIRVIVLVVEGDRNPREATIVVRDTLA